MMNSKTVVNKCNCRNKAACPPGNECFHNNIVYRCAAWIRAKVFACIDAAKD